MNDEKLPVDSAAVQTLAALIYHRDKIRDQANRYMVAVYGSDYVFRAPEAFPNILIRWIWAVAADQLDFAEEQMARIEELAAAAKE
jgi:hypothetical protein